MFVIHFLKLKGSVYCSRAAPTCMEQKSNCAIFNIECQYNNNVLYCNHTQKFTTLCFSTCKQPVH